ncbi:MAG: DUF6159 family protein, partial [Chloroflexota bacterium]
IKRSAALLKKTWGEQIAGNFGIGAVFGLVSLAIILFGVVFGGLAIVYLDTPAVAIAIFILMVIALVLLGLINSTLNGIYAAAVYQYAATGDTGGFFDENLVKNSFVSRNP